MCGTDGKQASAAQPESQSALKHNQETKGRNSYYYAHNRKFEVPEDAKVVRGPGLICGGPPEKLSSTAVPAQKIEKKPEAIRNYTWNEDDTLMKVSVDGGAIASATLEGTKCEFMDDEFTLSVMVDGNEHRLQVTLKKKIDPSGCKFRVSKGKGVRITLAKADKGKWMDLVKNKK